MTTHLMDLIETFGYHCDEANGVRESIQTLIRVAMNAHGVPIQVDDLFRRICTPNRDERYHEDFLLALWDLVYAEKLIFDRESGIVRQRFVLSFPASSMSLTASASSWTLSTLPWTESRIRASGQVRFIGDVAWDELSPPTLFSSGDFTNQTPTFHHIPPPPIDLPSTDE